MEMSQDMSIIFEIDTLDRLEKEPAMKAYY